MQVEGNIFFIIWFKRSEINLDHIDKFNFEDMINRNCEFEWINKGYRWDLGDSSAQFKETEISQASFIVLLIILYSLICFSEQHRFGWPLKRNAEG